MRGKESNELEESEIVGVSKDNYVEYVNQQKKLRGMIENLTEEKARELKIPRRTYYDWKMKIKGNIPIKLKKKLESKLNTI